MKINPASFFIVGLFLSLVLITGCNTLPKKQLETQEIEIQIERPDRVIRYPEELTIPEKKAEGVRVLEDSAHTHYGPSSYKLAVVLTNESKILPEKLQLIERNSGKAVTELTLFLPSYHEYKGVYECDTPTGEISYQTDWFYIKNYDLDFPDYQAAFGSDFFVKLVYQDWEGGRYFSTDQITCCKIDGKCLVTME